MRLRIELLYSIQVVHLITGVDEDNISSFLAGATLTTITGFTEWVSTTIPVITLGWDWKLTTVSGQPNCVQASDVRSNVMVVDAQRRDLGSVETAKRLSARIGQLRWHDEIIKAIRKISV